MKDCWSVLANDESLVTDIVEQLKKIVKATPLYKEQQQHNDKICMATLPPLQVCNGFFLLIFRAVNDILRYIAKNYSHTYFFGCY